MITREGTAGIHIGGKVRGETGSVGARQVSGGDTKTLCSAHISPITGWDVADINGDGRDEIVVGTLYGSLVILSEDGKSLGSALAGTEVTDLSTLRTPQGAYRVLVATKSGLSVYDANLRKLSEESVTGSPCVKIQRFSQGPQFRALCLFRDGTASAFTCGE